MEKVDRGKILKFFLWFAVFVEMVFQSRTIPLSSRLLYLFHFILIGIGFIWYKPRFWEKTDFTGKTLKKILLFAITYYLVGFILLGSYAIVVGHCSIEQSCSFASLGFLVSVILWPLAVIGIIMHLL